MMKRILKWSLRGLLVLLGVILAAAAALVVFLSVTEYNPADRQRAEHVVVQTDAPLGQKVLTFYTWNIGYAGLGKDSDFFMDGGKMVDPPSQQAVEENLAAIENFVASNPADGWLLQEVDRDSARSDYIDELQRITKVYTGSAAFSYNYNCPFVPIPLPPIGKVESGIATLTKVRMDMEAERIALPCPFSWPLRTANLKRCLQLTRLDLEGTDQELVLVNLHLEAYDDGEGKIAQTKLLLQILQDEYAKGNYVIAGGDFNQTFPGTLDVFPIQNSELWTPGVMEDTALPEGWQYAYDLDAPTCRLLDHPYDGTNQLYIIDGYIVSPNVRINAVETVDLQFRNSDHNPVRLDVTLLSE